MTSQHRPMMGEMGGDGVTKKDSIQPRVEYCAKVSFNNSMPPDYLDVIEQREVHQGSVRVTTTRDLWSGGGPKENAAEDILADETAKTRPTMQLLLDTVPVGRL
ncbi:hypothetical protein BIW11_02377 [Tropilaelaps mercedesae]|uniref:Uncharacterized protein n=1 Tax=Tropilaelaps mercedesae TaxID=418985 RepID=A0A1V9WYF1_9ACAR|nr:hypothetical protein BIW11_02377 [Tropilaelaps mercedesae]